MTVTGDDAAGRAKVAAKMAAVMSEVRRVHKGGYNDHHRYAFASASDVVDMIRGLLSRHGLALVQSPTDVWWEDVRTRNGTSTVCRGWFQMALVCGETGAQFVVPWLGEAQDSMDKGFNKAATAAQKYFLLKTFLVSTGDEEDPDAQGEPAPASKLDPATKAQVQAMRDLVLEMGGDWEKFVGFVSERSGGLGPESIDRDSAAGWIAYLQKQRADRTATAAAESDTERVKRRAKTAKKRETKKPERAREPGEEG